MSIPVDPVVQHAIKRSASVVVEFLQRDPDWNPSREVFRDPVTGRERLVAASQKRAHRGEGVYGNSVLDMPDGSVSLQQATIEADQQVYRDYWASEKEEDPLAVLVSRVTYPHHYIHSRCGASFAYVGECFFHLTVCK